MSEYRNDAAEAAMLKVLREADAPVPYHRLNRAGCVSVIAGSLVRAGMTRRGLIERVEAGFVLTDAGREQA